MRGVEVKEYRAIRIEGMANLAKRLYREYLETHEELLNLKDIAIAIGSTEEGHNIWSTIDEIHDEVLEAATA